MVASFLPVLYCALFRDKSTQTQVARNKWLTTNLLDLIGLVARGQNPGRRVHVLAPISLPAIVLLRNQKDAEIRQVMLKCIMIPVGGGTKWLL